MVNQFSSASVRRSSLRAVALLGSALGSTMVGGVAHAQNVTSSGNTDYTLTETGTRSGGPRTIDITTSGGNIALDVGTVNSENNTNTQGAAIAATNTGPGTVTIKDVNATATGTGTSYAIDARSTTGAISITTTGVVTATSTNTSRAISAISGGGNITINANESTGAVRGISTGFTGAAPALTTITSANATATGTGLVNAIVAQGERVVLTSGIATNRNAAGNGGTAIFVNTGAGGALVNAGTTTALGQGQAALQIFSQGAVDVTSGTVRTTQNSDGLSIASGTTVVVRSTDVVNSGANSGFGIVLGANRGGGGFNSGVDGFAYTSADVTSGTISTAGTGAYGIYATPNGGGATAITSGTITTTGANATGIVVAPIGNGTSSGAITIRSDVLTTTGATSGGILVSGNTGAVQITSGRLSATGVGINAGAATATVNSTELTAVGTGIQAVGTGAKTVTSGTVTVTGQGVTAINAQSTDGGAIAVRSTAINGTGTLNAFGINASGGNVQIDSGTMALSTTAPTNANASSGFGINAISSGAAANGLRINSGSIVYTGTGNTIGIQAQQVSTGGGTLDITSGTVTTTGNGGYAILGYSNTAAMTITSTGAATTVGTTRAVAGSTAAQDQRYADGIDAISAAGSIAVTNSGSINTTGAAARGIEVEAGRAITTFGTATTAASTAALSVNNSGSVTTRGANAFGINVQGDSGRVVISTNAVTTSGTGAVGVRVSTLGGDVSVANTGTITTSGANAIGVRIAPGAGALTINNAGTIATSGTGALGIFSSGSNGATITSNAITTSGSGLTTGIQVGSAAQATAPLTITSGTINLTNANSSGSGMIVVNSVAGPTTITSGTINIAGTGAGIAVQGPAGTTGDITITSGDINLSAPPSASFRQAIGTFATAGTTTINSTGTIQSGGNGILLQLRQGDVAGAVNITSNIINSANSAISVAAGSSVAIKASTTTTSGDGQAAIIVNPSSGGSVSIQAGSVTTTGANATGVAVTGNVAGQTSVLVGTAATTASAVDARSVGAVSVTAGSVQTTSANATGLTAISTGGTATVNSTTLTSANRGIYAQGLDNVTVTSGTLVSTNADFGLIARTSAAANNDPVVGTAEGVVTVTSTDLTATNIGINAYGPRATVTVNSGTVTTGNGTAIQAFGIDTNVTSRTINTGSFGIESGMGTGAARRGAAVVNSGVINVNGTVAGAVSGGISVNGSSVVVNSGTITSTGLGNRFGISAQVPFFTVAGTTAPGTVDITSGSITTVGDGAYGIQGISDSGALSITSTGTITTVGTTRQAGTQPRYSAGVVAFSVSGAITVDSNNISTSGAQSDGIRVEAGSGNQGTFNTSPNTAAAPILVTARGVTQTAGANAAGINVFGGGGTATIVNGGSVITSGAGAFGINVAAQGGATTLTSNAVATTGAGATGIRVTGTGAATLTTGTTSATGGTAIQVAVDGLATVQATSATGTAGLAVTGGTGVSLNVGSASSTGATTTDANTGVTTRADAIFAQATNGTVIAQVGSASAVGAGADGVRLIANGTGGAVTLAVSGTVTSAAGTGIFIDPPGAVNVTLASTSRVSGATGGINTTGGTNTINNAGSITSTGGAGIIATGTTAIDNSGTIAGGAGTAVQLGATNDAVTLRTGSVVTGAIQGGGGTDTATLIGSANIANASQTVATLRDFAGVTVQSGYWTAGVANGSTVGTTTVASGAALQVSNGVNGIASGYQTATIADNGDLIVVSDANSAGSTFGATTVSGSGRVRFAGTGTATLGGNNSLANTGTNTVDAGSTVVVTGTQGGTFVNNGVFQIGTGGTTGNFTGNVVDNGTLVVNRSDTFTFTGALTGAGTLVKNGTGQVVFGPGYAFTGTTQLNGGSVKLSAPVAATTELDVRGTGTIDLSGQNNTIAELQGNSAGATVNIAGGTLTVNQATNTTFAGVLAGAAGNLVKTGIGTLGLAGVNTYTGTTTVSGGTLAINGSITSAVTVASGGRLSGTGTITGNVAVASGGTLAPGNSIGTQTIAGNLSFAAGSTFAVEANAAGQADRVNASGTATINGGTVAVTAAAGSYAPLTSYTILTAAGGVTGRFTNATANLAFLSPLLTYSANSVSLLLARNDVAFSTMAASPNGTAAANAIAARGLGDTIYNTILFQSASGASGTFDQLSGEVGATVPAVLVDSGRRIRELVLNRAATREQGVGVWLEGLQDFARSRYQAGYSGVRTNRTGVYGGIDFGSDTLRVGVSGGYVDQDIRLPGRASTANVDTKLVGGSVAYVPAAIGLTAAAGVTHAWHDLDTVRTVSVTGLGATLTSSGKARSTEAFGEVGYAVAFDTVTVTPFVRYTHDSTTTDRASESGGTAALTLGRDSRSVDFISLGARLGGRFDAGTVRIEPKGSISYEHGSGDLRDGRSASFTTGTGPAFTVTGVRIGRDTINGDIGADLVTTSGLRIGASGFASRSAEWQDYGGKLTLGLRF